MSTKNDRVIASVHSALDKLATIAPATTIADRAHRVAGLALAEGRSATALRSAIVDALGAGDERKAFMALVREELGIDAALPEREVRKAEPAFNAACNAWAYAAKEMGLSKPRKPTGPRAGKGDGEGDGENDDTPPVAAPSVDFAARLGQWLASAEPETIAQAIESATSKAKARQIAEALADAAQ